MKKLFTLLLTTILFACTPIDPFEPTPSTPNKPGNTGGGNSNGNQTEQIKDAIANFSYDPIKAYDGQQVTFTNSSSNAYYYDWDFGNGKTSKEKNPKTTFEAGTWTVTLTAWNKDKSQHDRLQKTINIKEKPTKVYFTGYTINSLDWEDSDGRYWDDTSKDAPDVFFRILDSNNKTILETDVYTNLSADKLPYTSYDFYYTELSLNKSYKIQLVDYDTWSDDVMLSYTFNPIEHLTSYQESITLNFKEGTNGKFSLTLKFQFD